MMFIILSTEYCHKNNKKRHEKTRLHAGHTRKTYRLATVLWLEINQNNLSEDEKLRVVLKIR